MSNFSPPALSPPPPRPWRPPPSPRDPDKSLGNTGGIIGGCFGFLAVAIVLALFCRVRRNAAPPAAPPAPGQSNSDEQQVRRASPTAGLPSFTYSQSMKHNVTTGSGDDDEAATCSVCLAAFQAGETVRLLPVCLHLYHVDCIDPWLDAHATCPVCRSGTDPAMDGSLLPPV